MKDLRAIALRGLLALVGVLAAAQSFAESPADDWAGKRIVLKSSDIPLWSGKNPIEKTRGKLAIYFVERSKGPWLLVHGDDIEGWAAAEQVVEAEQAIGYFANRLKTNPKDAHALAMRGVLWDEVLKEPDFALVELNEAIRIEPKRADFWLARASAWLLKKDVDKAMVDFNKAVKIDPKNPGVWKGRAEGWYLMQDYHRAMADLNQAIALDPRLATAFESRGVIWLAQNEQFKAMSDFNEAIRLDPKSAGGYAGRGGAWLLKREYDKAIADLNEAVRLDPYNDMAFSNRGGAWLYKRDFNKALLDFTKAISLDPKNALAYSNRGGYWCIMGAYDKAIADFSQAIKLEPDYAIALSNRGSAWYFKRDYEKAIADCTEAIRIDPYTATARLTRAYARYLSKKGDAAHDVHEIVMHAGWSHPIAAHAAVIGYLSAMSMQKPREAEALLKDAAAKADRDIWPYPIVAFLLGELNDKDLVAMASDDDQLTEIHCILGITAVQKDRPDLALEHFRWVKERGSAGHLLSGIALTELAKLESKFGAEPKRVATKGR